MPRISRSASAIFLLLAAACSAPAPSTGPAPEGPASVAITGVSVVDVESGAVRAGQTVVVRGDRIVSVGPAARARVPAGAAVVDGRGKFVIPGLWDMHVHAWDRELNTALFAAFGVTGVRDMASMPPMGAWRDSIRAGTARGPRMLAAGPILDGANPIWGAMPGFSIPVTNAAEAAAAVDSVAARRWDMVKVYTKLTAEPFFAIAAESKRRGLPMVGHVPDLVSVAEASDAGMRSIEHNYGLEMACSSREAELRDSLRVALAPEPAWPVYGPVQSRIFAQAAASRDAAKCRALYERLAENGTYWTPTLTVLRGFAFMGDSAELARLPMEYARKGMYWQAVRPVTPEQRARREEAFGRRIAEWGEMRRAGVPILAGTDLANPNVIAGWSLHDELSLLVRAGLSPLEALRAATLTPARYMGAMDSMGTVAAGRVADLVVLDANPLEDVRNTQRIHAVVARGRLIGAAEREALLTEARAIAAKPMAFPAGGYAPEGEHRH